MQIKRQMRWYDPAGDGNPTEPTSVRNPLCNPDVRNKFWYSLWRSINSLRSHADYEQLQCMDYHVCVQRLIRDEPNLLFSQRHKVPKSPGWNGHPWILLDPQGHAVLLLTVFKVNESSRRNFKSCIFLSFKRGWF